MYLNPKNGLFRCNVLTAIILIVFTGHAFAGINESIENTLKFGKDDGKYGQVAFDLTYRYEYADTENTPPRTADANTFRLRLGYFYLTPDFQGVQGFVAYEDIYVVQNDYNGSIAYADEYDFLPSKKSGSKEMFHNDGILVQYS